VIDEHIRRPWPPEVTEALKQFKQGDVIQRPPFFYARHTELELFDAGAPDHDESQVVELHPDDAPPYGIITTQTCDLAEQGTPTQPWFQVSPVYEVAEEARASKSYLIELTGELPGRFGADLRIELPLEKSMLVGRVPIAGFGTEAEAEDFGRFLGARRARAALANELVETITRVICCSTSSEASCISPPTARSRCSSAAAPTTDR
jgi:hypothetical protein